MLRIKLLCALQVLTVPEAGVSYARAREVIREILSLDELPAYPPEVQPSLELYLETWLGLSLTNG